MRKTFFIILICCINNLSAQQCKVIPDSLNGNYIGECKKGLANGQGTAKGVDTYIGSFKSGYPDGKGKYIWKNGSWFDGNWKKGIYNGEGTMHIVKPDSANNTDLTGFWRDGKYIGAHEHPYIINLMTNKVSDVSVTKGQGHDDILIIVKDANAGASTLNTQIVPKQKLTDIQIQSGSFSNKVDDEATSPITNRYKLNGVIYPIHLLLYFGSERLDIEVSEKGSWNIAVTLEKM